MKFKKYQCLENDFIIVEDYVLDVKRLCDEHKFIGADGLIVYESNKFYFFNKDGTKAKFCGNGVRCAIKYLNDYYDETKDTIIFEDMIYNISHVDNIYKLKSDIVSVEKCKKNYFVDTGVKHLVVLQKPTHKKAFKLFKKYNCNITFYYDNKASTYEKGVGFTRGCGSGLLAIMNVLYHRYNVINKVIYSNDNKSKIIVKDNNIYLESEVFFMFEGEIKC